MISNKCWNLSFVRFTVSDFLFSVGNGVKGAALSVILRMWKVDKLVV